MKKMITLPAVLLAGFLATAALAADQGNSNLPAQAQNGQAQKDQVLQGQESNITDSEALTLQKEYLQKREEMKKRRDAAEKLRSKNIKSGNPGNTGM